MKKIKVPFSAIGEVSGSSPTFPKFVSPILNTINQGTQATRPKNVGQMTDLAQEFMDTYTIKSLERWKQFYDSKMPGAIERAIDKNAAVAITFSIDRSEVEKWMKDLIYNKTYQGLMAQEAIGKCIAEEEGKSFKRASRTEESQGIDGWIGDEPISIKPTSYDKTIPSHYENIKVRMVVYKKNKDGFVVRF